MDSHSQARQLFVRLITRPDPAVPLAEAALAIAWEDQGGPAPRRALDQLDALSAALAPRLGGLAGPAERIAALAAFLGDEQGFRGEPGYDRRPDPANAYLDQVLERRRGLPILLSLIYLELGRRHGLPLTGLALPGHFLICYRDPAGDHYLDPFSGGAAWTRADCEQQIASFYGQPSPELIDALMAAPSHGAILARILRNLKQIALARDNSGLALRAVERLILLDPGDPGEIRDRGLLQLRLGRLYAALEDLETYARRDPSAADLLQIRSFARELVERLSRDN